jgi:hypothetical protein
MVAPNEPEEAHIADAAIFHELARSYEFLIEATLEADLQNDSSSLRVVHCGAGVGKAEGYRLLAQDVLTGIGCLRDECRVGVRRSSDDDAVYGRVREQRFHVIDAMYARVRKRVRSRCCVNIRNADEVSTRHVTRSVANVQCANPSGAEHR